jgi:DNA-binding CsgD family transcriptional regulator
VLAAARPLRRLAITAPAHQPGLLTWPVHCVNALVDLGRTEEAEAELEAHAQLACAQDNRPWLFTAAWLTGVIAAARRDSGRARCAFDRAFELGDNRTPGLEQILARYQYGRFLRRRGERRRAAEVLHEARARAAQLRAAPLIGRCEEELAACGVPVGGPVPLAPMLTPQEQVIAGLVCAGHSNRQVAAKLVLSPKTVGYHLSNVYTKLGVHSRLQLAEALRRQG